MLPSRTGMIFLWYMVRFVKKLENKYFHKSKSIQIKTANMSIFPWKQRIICILSVGLQYVYIM